MTWDAKVEGFLEIDHNEPDARDIPEKELKEAASAALIDGCFHVKEIRIHDVMPRS